MTSFDLNSSIGLGRSLLLGDSSNLAPSTRHTKFFPSNKKQKQKKKKITKKKNPIRHKVGFAGFFTEENERRRFVCFSFFRFIFLEENFERKRTRWSSCHRLRIDGAAGVLSAFRLENPFRKPIDKKEFRETKTKFCFSLFLVFKLIERKKNGVVG